MKVLEFPLSKIAICCIAGIALSSSFHFSVLQLLFTGFGFLFGTLLLHIFAARRLKRSSVTAILFCLVGFVTGAVSTRIHDESARADHFTKISTGEENNLTLVVREKIKSSAKYERYFAEVTQIGSRHTSGKVLLNVKRPARHIITGSEISTSKAIIAPTPPLNPDQFDYNKYLRNKGVFGQVHATQEDISIAPPSSRDIFYFADRLRSRIINNLRHAGFAETELQVAMALLMGQQQDISSEVAENYRAAGAVHILSVSGLHVGFILLFLNFLLKPLPKTGLYNTFRLLVIICSLWIFAVVAGLSPSVVRSTTMFSFLAVGMFIGRQTNTFHTLLTSMLLILIFEPSFLFDVGFQLSYLALFFILWLQPEVAKWWQPRGKPLQYIRDILSVSFAAQLGTLPLTLYYFHQFPGLFFLTNLIIIPMLSIIMIVGVLVMLASAIGIIPVFAMKLLQWGIFVMNLIIGWVASFDALVLREISFSLPMMLATFLLIIALSCFVRTRSRRNFAFVLCSVILLQVGGLATKWFSSSQSELIVLNTRGNSAVLARNGQHLHAFTDDSTTSAKSVQPYATANYIKTVRYEKLRNAFEVGKRQILIIDSSGVYPNGLNADVVILRQSPKINLDRMIATLRPSQIVADASNFKSYAGLWSESCRKQKIPFHYTNEKGFFRMSD